MPPKAISPPGCCPFLISDTFTASDTFEPDTASAGLDTFRDIT